ncbi:MAG: Efflux ABC transporter, permease protein [uncultured Nocardioidaceae bacterium]|uniref:Transport permease protein n=1 Tax=uncultured Nocardioidaceae bacterium TaxID=253824 RepID=A0A6J4M5H9_9ACTN|nr:MAG: Efflux ABC transporter, permease protein [uncultured Nocardioidaceae bacterium]
MTALDARRPPTSQQGGGSWALKDTWAMAGRNVRRLTRQPEQVVFNIVSPIMFVLLFRYVFGGAIGGLQGLNYVNYLIPGIAVQTVLFSAGVTGFALADDLQKGFIYRLRSLPMARSAVFGGRVVADTGVNAFGLVVLILTGFAVGFRPESAPGLLLAGILLLLFALAVSLGYALIGMVVRSPEGVNAATFPIIFPATFASSAFVPVETMPSWLQGFATHQPVSVVINAARALILGDSVTADQREFLLAGQSTSSLVLQALAWTIGIGVVLGVLCTRKYRNLT